MPYRRLIHHLGYVAKCLVEWVFIRKTVSLAQACNTTFYVELACFSLFSLVSLMCSMKQKQAKSSYSSFCYG